jgi:anti-sigma regulatory factor (Ser/Thr protein kinase)
MTDIVDRHEDHVRVEGRITERTALWVIGKIREAVHQRGFEAVTLDLTDLTRAWPDGMLPLICEIESLRRAGYVFRLVPPSDETLQRLFVNCNWAAFIAPNQFDRLDQRTPSHLPATWYDASNHKDIVDQVVEIVMGNMQVSRPVLAGLEWSVNEITDNVLVHAESSISGIVQVVTQLAQQRITFVVADAGRGILASMREGFPRLRDDEEAVAEAMKQGVTRDPSIGQGNGLAGALRIATLSNGSFSVMSGQALLSVYRDTPTGQFGEHRHHLPPYHRYDGTVVTAELDSSAPLRLEEALGFQSPDWEPFDYVDAVYTSEDGRSLRVALKDETAGFGSRIAGQQVRTKCLNLLTSDPSLPLVLDWEGVPLVSSSFADEAIGKLYADLGPLTFGRRVHSINLEPLVRSLIERAIVQRLAQQAGAVRHI